jgi:DNA-binding CsgD family transcriptional regulator
MKKIKKITVKIPLDKLYHAFFEKLARFELLEIHRLDERFVISTELIKFKDVNHNPKELLGSFGIEFIEILSEDLPKNEFICFAKTRLPKELKIFFKDPEIILCVPLIMEENSLLLSFMTDNDKIDIVWNAVQQYNVQYKILSISTVLSPNETPYSKLTERQRKIIYYAVENGYYEIPRQITTVDLAEKFNISPSALNEHLRKIERKIFHSMFK